MIKFTMQASRIDSSDNEIQKPETNARSFNIIMRKYFVSRKTRSRKR